MNKNLIYFWKGFKEYLIGAVVLISVLLYTSGFLMENEYPIWFNITIIITCIIFVVMMLGAVLVFINHCIEIGKGSIRHGK